MVSAGAAFRIGTSLSDRHGTLRLHRGDSSGQILGAAMFIPRSCRQLALLLALLLLHQIPVAFAGAIGATFIAFNASYSPVNDPSEYLRLLIDNQSQIKKFDPATLDMASSSLTIRRGAKRIYVPIAQVAPSQLPIGMLVRKSGFVDFRPIGGFKPGDKINVTLYFNTHVDYRTSGGAWRDGDGTVNDSPRTNGSLKMPGQTSIFDPVYTSINDLDPNLFSADSSFSVRNLSFLGNQTQDQLDRLDLDQILNGFFPPGTTQAPEFELLSSLLHTNASLFAKEFVNPFNEPDPGLYSVAIGQFDDPLTSDAVDLSFVHAFRAIPEPGTAMLSVLAVVVLGYTRVRTGRQSPPIH